MKNCLNCNKPLLTEDNHYGQHLICFQRVFQISEKLEFHSLARKEATSQKNKKNQPPHLTSYFAGNYKKYEGKLDTASYILKFSKPEYPELAAVEYVCNVIAVLCGITISTPFSLIEIQNTELAFVTKNFMHALQQHTSLVHIYHYLPKGQNQYTVETLSRVIYEQTVSANDVKMFFKTILFDALVGNHDRHGSNLAFIATSKGKRLSPIYDNPSYLGLETGSMLTAHFSPKGKIWTCDSHEPTMRDYCIELLRLGVGDVGKDFFNALPYDKITHTIDDTSCLSPNMKNALKKLIHERYLELEAYAKGE